MSQKKKSTHFVSGLAIGAAVAGAAAFLYKTKKGKHFRKQFKPHIDNAKGFLAEHLKEAKTQAKKIEAQLMDSNQEIVKKTKKVKRKVNKAADQVKKKVFLKSGKPLAN